MPTVPYRHPQLLLLSESLPVPGQGLLQPQIPISLQTWAQSALLVRSCELVHWPCWHNVTLAALVEAAAFRSYCPPKPPAHCASPSSASRFSAEPGPCARRKLLATYHLAEELDRILASCRQLLPEMQ